jgi:hypothetical protein
LIVPGFQVCDLSSPFPLPFSNSLHDEQKKEPLAVTEALEHAIRGLASGTKTQTK